MQLIVRTAQRQCKDINGQVISKGERYLQLHNGTIGAGARASNIKKDEAIKTLSELINELIMPHDVECDRCGDYLTEEEVENESTTCGACHSREYWREPETNNER